MGRSREIPTGEKLGDNLMEDLELARFLFGDGCDEVDLEQVLEEAAPLAESGNSRAAWIEGLRGLLGHVREEGVLPIANEARLLAPLDHLLRALEALNDGVIDDGFRAIPNSGGAGLYIDDLLLRLYAGLVVDVLKRAGESRAGAFKLVSDELTRQGFMQRRRKQESDEPITQDTVENWCERQGDYRKRLKVLSEKSFDQHFRHALLRLQRSGIELLPPAGSKELRFVANFILDHVVTKGLRHLAKRD